MKRDGRKNKAKQEEVQTLLSVTKSLSELMAKIMHKSAVKEYQLTVSTAQTSHFCAQYVIRNKHAKV
jgi:hypothetical protein